MGHWYSKVGSAPFYASVERSLERLQTDAANLKVQRLPCCLRCEELSPPPPFNLAPVAHSYPSRSPRALQAQTAERQRRRAKISSTILWYSCLIFAALFLHALWVRPLSNDNVQQILAQPVRWYTSNCACFRSVVL